MDPRKLFFDQRHSSFCAYCGAVPSSDDHVPSRVLLDQPFPNDLPVVLCCTQCNNRFSFDEPYVACLIDCVQVGSVDPEKIGRQKVKDIFLARPQLQAEVQAAINVDAAGETLWRPDVERVVNIVMKLARGHAAYECGEPMLDEPISVAFEPISSLQSEALDRFESVPVQRVWPEIGSRAFSSAIIGRQDRASTAR